MCTFNNHFFLDDHLGFTPSPRYQVSYLKGYIQKIGIIQIYKTLFFQNSVCIR